MATQSKTQALQTYLATKEDALAKWVKGAISPATLIRFALHEYAGNDKLQKCSPESIYLALIASAQFGLEPSGITGEAYIVPFKGVATFIPGYRGLVKLARRSGEVRDIYAYVVHDGDVFKPTLGTSPGLLHEPLIEGRGEPIAVYAVADMMGDYKRYELMTWNEVNYIREQSFSGGSPAWEKWPDQMGRKCPIRRMAKTLPLGVDFARAARIDELASIGDMRGYREVIDVHDEVGDLPTQDEVTDADFSEVPPGDEPEPSASDDDLIASMKDAESDEDWLSILEDCNERTGDRRALLLESFKLYRHGRGA